MIYVLIEVCYIIYSYHNPENYQMKVVKFSEIKKIFL